MRHDPQDRPPGDRAAGRSPPTPTPPEATDPHVELIAARVRATDGRISAKRLLPILVAEGYTGSGRTLRRAVHEAKADLATAAPRLSTVVPVPGEHLAIDWGVIDGLHVFCAVLAWSRVRFVRFAEREDQATTLRLLAECFEVLGGCPRWCSPTGWAVSRVAWSPTSWCRHRDTWPSRPTTGSGPTSARRRIRNPRASSRTSSATPSADLVIGCGPFADVATANAAAIAWCDEVNGRIHSETSAVPAERLVTERTLLRPLPSLRPAIGPIHARTVDALRTVRFGSARYSVPGTLIGKRVKVVVDGPELVIRHAGTEVTRHPLVGPGGMSLLDDHYGGPARKPARALRPRTPAEIAFLGLGPIAEAFLRRAAAAGATRLPAELALIADLERAHGRAALLAALERAVAHRRFRASDVRASWPPVPGSSAGRPAGVPLTAAFPTVPVRSLAAYAIEPAR